MASSMILPYDGAFLRRLEEMGALLDADDPKRLYAFLREEFGYLFKACQYYTKIALGEAQDFEAADESIRKELMRPLSHRQYRMVERAFLGDEAEVIGSLWDFLHDNGRVYEKKVMSAAEVSCASLILEQVYCALAAK